MGKLWALVVVLSGCYAPAAETCSDGTVCPANYQCDVVNHRCLTPAELAACDGIAEGEPCTVDDRPGACHAGACDVFYCGDGVRTGTEACDGTDLGGLTCRDVGFYDLDGLACDNRCTFDTRACGGGRCGDHLINGPELCDGSTSQTCVGIGFDAGSLDCNTECGLSIAECTRFGWTPESLTDVIANAVGGSSPQDEWAVGLGGKTMHYQGAFWNAVLTPVNNPLVAVWAIAPDDAWTVGLGPPSVVLHWDGVAWTTVSDAPTGAYDDVWAASATAVFLAARDVGVQRWNGTTWASVGNLAAYHPIAIRGTSATDLWVATAEGTLLHGDGSAWSPAGPSATAVHFIDANSPTDVWVIGSDPTDLSLGVIAHWNGTAWKQDRRPGEIYNNVASSAPNDAWVAGSDGKMRHFDGVAWSDSLQVGASPSGLAAVSGFISFGPGEVVAVSTLNLAYRYRGQSFGRFPTFGPDPFAASQNTAIWSTAANDVYVTDVKGAVWHYDGALWKIVFQIAADGHIGANAVWGSGPSDVWIAGGDGRVFHNIGGATWAPEDVSNLAISHLWGSGPGDLWAFSTSGAWHREANGTWTAHSLGNQAIASVSGSSASDVWAIAADARAWHWDGTAWSEVTTGAPTPLYAVVTLGDDDVFVAARDGRIRRFHANAWTEVTVPALAQITFLASTAPDDVIAASARELFHFDGKQWSPMRTPVDFVPNTPDYIPIAGLAATPGRIDLMLERYRVDTMLRTRPIVCRPTETDCHDAVDDDCDGRIDQLDPDCP